MHDIAPCVLIGPKGSQVAFGPDPAGHVQGILGPVITHFDQEATAKARRKLPTGKSGVRAAERRIQQVAVTLSVSTCPPRARGPSAADCKQTAAEESFWRLLTTPLSNLLSQKRFSLQCHSYSNSAGGGVCLSSELAPLWGHI